MIFRRVVLIFTLVVFGLFLVVMQIENKMSAQECLPSSGVNDEYKPNFNAAYSSLRVELYGYHPTKNFMSAKHFLEKISPEGGGNILCINSDGNILFDESRKVLEGLPQEAKDEYLRYGNWFLNNQTLKTSNDLEFSTWQFNFDYDRYGLKSGWVSALSQGFGIQLLIRSYLMTGLPQYLKAAKLAAASYRVDIESGGVLHVDSKGYHWYEEYPSKPRSFVLNGFVLSLFGIFELAQLTGNKEYYEVFESGVKTLEAHLPSYFMPPNRSKYDLIDSLQRFRLTPEVGSAPLIGDIVLQSNPNSGARAGRYMFPVDSVGDLNITEEALGAIVKKNKLYTFRELVASTNLYISTPENVDVYGYSRLDVNFFNFDAGLKVEIYDGYRYIKLNEIQRYERDDLTTVSYDISNAYLRGKEAHEVYVKLHSEILRDLYRITNKAVFDQYSRLWAGVK